jgi:hypothetical protein
MQVSQLRERDPMEDTAMAVEYTVRIHKTPRKLRTLRQDVPAVVEGEQVVIIEMQMQLRELSPINSKGMKVKRYG